MFRLRGKKKDRHGYQAIEPDEILIDAQNLPEFDTTRLEGRIERPIGANTFRAFSVLIAIMALILAGQLVKLQVVRYAALAKRAEANTLDQSVLAANRGLITDRNGVPLAANKASTTPELALREYPLGAAAANLIGYVSYPKRDQNGNWYQKKTEGVVGIEAADDARLAGQSGVVITETDAAGKTVSGSIIRPAQDGQDVRLSIDAGLQKELYDELQNRAETTGWRGGTGAIMDVATGEILAVASYPSFDPAVMSSGEPRSQVKQFLADGRSPFLDRAVSGLYTPGSVVKPFIGAAVLQERIIAPDKQILSTGSLSVPNPYDPTHPSIFKDWRANGWVDMRGAISVSSDVYFYEVGGGFENQPGLGISAIERYMRAFGFGQETGVALAGEESGTIPDPQWKANNFEGEAWFLGDTYHTAIGQYGFQVTVMQLVRGVAAIANGGTLVTPVIEAGQQGTSTSVPVSGGNLGIIREGMRLCVTQGICKTLDVAGVTVAGKTGTAQTGAHNESMNSLVEGFFPYDHPRYAFAIVMEHAPANTLQGALSIMNPVLKWIVANRPEMVTAGAH